MKLASVKTHSQTFNHMGRPRSTEKGLQEVRQTAVALLLAILYIIKLYNKEKAIN